MCVCVILPHLYTSGEKRQADTRYRRLFLEPGEILSPLSSIRHRTGSLGFPQTTSRMLFSCCSAGIFFSFFFFPTFIFPPPKATGSGGGAGETNQGDYRTEGGQRQEVAPEGELDETEGDLYTRAVFEQTELRSGSGKRD